MKNVIIGSSEQKLNRLSTDVLIIGSGGTGLRAAIEARRQGVNVLLISKSKTGLANCTASAMGAFKVSKEEKGIAEHFRETLEAGRFLNNPNLVRTLVTEAWHAVRELEKFGVELVFENGKASVIAERPPAGIILSKALSSYALSLGVTVLENAIAFDLPVEGNRCLGALVFKKDTGEIIAVSAKATVLATGGYARLYIRNDNPPTITGDGLVLAFRAGAELQDLEYVQFQPMFIDAGVPRMPILDWLIEATKNLIPGGPLLNENGERFLARYKLIEQKILRDNLIVAIERELYEGKRHKDSVILDLTSLSPEEIEGAFDSEFYKCLIDPFKQTLSTRKLHIASFAHYTMGGIRINEKCETKVEGLYAAGEVAGGIHGANRLGGNALTDIIVFGAIAGRQAADYAQNARLSSIAKKQVREGERIVHEFRDKAKPEKFRPSLIGGDVRSIVSKFCRSVRNEEGLKFALERLKQIEEKIPFMFADNSDQLGEAIEANFMLLLSKLVVNSALVREESRGSHFRVDYPQYDDENWTKNIVITNGNGIARVRYEPICKGTS